MGAQALVEALALMEQDMLRPVPQEETRATYAPKITRETARIRWDAGPDAVMRATLALDPKPGAWTTLNGQEIKLFHAHVGEGSGTSGTVLRRDDRFVVAAGAGAVVVEEVQPTGKSRMTAAEWIRGRGVAVGQQFV